jgi:transcriptional regulator
MYSPSYFQETRPEVMHDLMRAHALACIVVTTPDGLVADHVPLHLCADGSEHGSLVGHVARANPLWRNADGAQVLVIFQGDDAYISPNWYPSKAVDGKVVPTWNYAVVHAHGTLRAIHDAAWILDLLNTLTNEHEQSQSHPWKVEDAPADFTDKLLAAIIGIQIDIQSLSGKWKMSQNRPASERAGVADGLNAVGSDTANAMAQLVRP